MIPAYVALVVVLTIMQVIVFSLLVGRGRMKYGVAAPATSGHPTWDRLHRVHLNSVENAVLSMREPEGRFLGSVLTVVVQLVLAIGTLSGILATLARA